MKIYAIIPARGGSKGVPGKNVKTLIDKPLIAWTIAAAQAVPEVTRVIVNTDDDDIAAAARAAGAEVFMRPAHLAEDLTLDLPVFLHHLEALKEADDLPDMVVDLRATAPLRGAKRIREGIQLLMNAGKEGADSVRAVTKATKHPYKMWRHRDGVLEPFVDEATTGMKEPYNAARQMLPAVYQNNGSMNAFWPHIVLEKGSMTGDRILGYVMDEWESVNIDTPIDFMVAEQLLRDRGGLLE